MISCSFQQKGNSQIADKVTPVTTQNLEHAELWQNTKVCDNLKYLHYYKLVNEACMHFCELRSKNFTCPIIDLFLISRSFQQKGNNQIADKVTPVTTQSLEHAELW